MSRLSRPGAETDGGRKHLEVVGRNRPECWQDELDAEGQAEGGERRLAALEALGHQADERDQGGTHGLESPPCPADGAGQQHVVSADDVSGSLDRSGLLDLVDNLLDVLQRAGEPRGEAVGEQAERLPLLWTIPARNACARWVEPRVGADAVKAATTLRVPGTSLEACQLPRLLVNVFLAGEAKTPSKLHRPRPARVKAVAGHLFVFLAAWGSHHGAPMRKTIGRYSLALLDRESVSPVTVRGFGGAVNHEGIRAATALPNRFPH